MKTLRFHDYGEPADVLRLEHADVPIPRAGHVRVRVHACGLNPADWALCRGLFAAVQMALMKGARVIAAAGDTFAGQLRALGAEVTPYGAGMVERVREIAGGAPHLIFDAGPISDVLPDLVRIAGGDAHRVVTVSNHGPAADALGVRNSFAGALGYPALREFATLAAEGRFTVPVARTFPLEQWREALAVSLSGRAHGKLVLLPGA